MSVSSLVMCTAFAVVIIRLFLIENNVGKSLDFASAHVIIGVAVNRNCTDAQAGHGFLSEIRDKL